MPSRWEPPARGTPTKLGGGFGAELDRLRQQFEQGDFMAFMEALLLCTWNELPLPDWVATMAIDNAERVWMLPKGRGRQGNWQALYDAKLINDRRADLVHMHMRARRRAGRHFLSGLAAIHGYGKEIPDQPLARIVTRADIFAFVSDSLKGTPAKGTQRAIEVSYTKALQGGRFGPTSTAH